MTSQLMASVVLGLIVTYIFYGQAICMMTVAGVFSLRVRIKALQQ